MGGRPHRKTRMAVVAAEGGDASGSVNEFNVVPAGEHDSCCPPPPSSVPIRPNQVQKTSCTTYPKGATVRGPIHTHTQPP